VFTTSKSHRPASCHMAAHSRTWAQLQVLVQVLCLSPVAASSTRMLRLLAAHTTSGESMALQTSKAATVTAPPSSAAPHSCASLYLSGFGWDGGSGPHTQVPSNAVTRVHPTRAQHGEHLGTARQEERGSKSFVAPAAAAAEPQEVTGRCTRHSIGRGALGPATAAAAARRKVGEREGVLAKLPAHR